MTAWSHALSLTGEQALRGERALARVAVTRLLQDGALQALSALGRAADRQPRGELALART